MRYTWINARRVQADRARVDSTFAGIALMVWPRRLLERSEDSRIEIQLFISIRPNGNGIEFDFHFVQ